MDNVLNCLNIEVDIDSDSDNFSDIDEYFCIKSENIEDNDIIKEKEYIVGIDLGTSNSCISVWRNNNLEIIPDKYGNKTIPSVVSFTNCNRYIGKDAKNQQDINSGNVVYEVKRLMGKKIDDTDVQKDIPFLSYYVTENDNQIVIGINGKQKLYTPEEISAMILSRLKIMAEDYLKQSITKAVITVPAYFNDGQRQATVDAATIAGLECIRIINEPTAAALPYGYEKMSLQSDTDINIIVYDFGGGTLDVSLLSIADGIFEVIGSTGNSHLGGVDFDNRLFSYCKSFFKNKYNIDKLDNILVLSLQKLKKECERAKKKLSTTGKAVIAVKDFYDNKNLVVPITRNKLEEICNDYITLCMKYIDDILEMCDMDIDDIDDIILVGGATRMPIIRENIKKYFKGKEPNCTINPDEIVAAGAAMQGSILSNNQDPFSEKVVLVDIIPLSLGVETIGGVMNILIPRNSTIPIKKKRKYTTYTDYETDITIKVFEGERKMTKDNFLVGEFELTGLEPAPRGIPEIEITFSVDVNGIISVTAEDIKNNQNKNSIVITGNKSRLSKEKIESLVKEAQDMELQDKLERERKNSFYEIDNLCDIIKTNVNNEEFKLTQKDKEIILTDINEVLTWLEEMHYNERDQKDYDKIIERIKRKYPTLILKININSDIIGISESKENGTIIFGEDENTLFEELENDEYGFDKDTNNSEKNEIKQLKKELIDMCYSIYNIINDSCFIIDKKDFDKIQNIINDTLLWVFSREKVIKTEYVQRINELNSKCNEIVKDNSSSYIYTKREELEQLCYILLADIEYGTISLDKENEELLVKKINDTLQEITSIKVNKRRAEISGDIFDIDDSIYSDKINEINTLCNNLNDTRHTIDHKDNIITNYIDKKDNDIYHGTSISELRTQNT